MDIRSFFSKNAKKRPVEDADHDDGLFSKTPRISSPGPCLKEVLVPRFDVSLYVGKKLTSDEKYQLLTNVYEPDSSFKFPSTKFGSKNRSFQHSWLRKYPGLAYSPSLDGAYCLHCVLFSDDISKHGQLVKDPFRNWKRATERFDEHFFKKKHNSGDASKSSHRVPGTGFESHMNCSTRSQEFMIRCQNIQPDVNVAISKALEERRKKNLEVLQTVVETIIICGRQNISLRGHRDDSKHEAQGGNLGNFKALLQYRASGGDTCLQEHMSHAPKNATYFSKTIQNDIINIIGEHIQRKIVEDCQGAGGWFSVSADEVRDISNKEQLAVTIRFSCNIREEFLSFLDVSEGTTGESLSNAILELLQRLNLDPYKMRSQCYDGAGNMAGKVKGVGARISNRFPKALPFWCSAHQLNRCIVQACSVASVRNMMGTADQVVRFFEFSPKKQFTLEGCIERCIGDDANRKKLKELCRTRWVERHDAFAVFIDLLPAIVEALEVFSKEPNTRTPGTPDATSLLYAVCNFEFVVCLIIVQRSLSYIKGLTKTLQERSLDVCRGLRLVQTVQQSLEDCRNNVNDFHGQCFNDAKDICESLDIDVRKPRTCSRQTNRANVPAESTETYYRRAITAPLLDHLITQMQDRFTDLHSRAATGLLLVPAAMSQMPNREELSFFMSDLPSPDSLDAKLIQWFATWSNTSDEKPATISEALQKCDPLFFSNIHVMLQICATFPVTSCECERSISVLRLLKSYLRASMGQERMSSLALMYIHRTLKIDPKDIAVEFARRQPRRMVVPNFLVEQ